MEKGGKFKKDVNKSEAFKLYHSQMPEMQPQAKYDFAIFTHYVKGIIFTGSVLEHSGVPFMKNEWKLLFKRLLTDARNYEKELAKGLKDRAEAEDETNSAIYDHLYKIISLEDGQLEDYLAHCNSWSTKWTA